MPLHWKADRHSPCLAPAGPGGGGGGAQAALPFLAPCTGRLTGTKHGHPCVQGLVAAEEEFSAITDKIPQRPVTVTEAGGYSLVIVAALGVSGLQICRIEL